MRILLLILILLLVAKAQAATYWVNTTGNDSNGCTNTTSDPGSGAKQHIGGSSGGLSCLKGPGDTLMIGNGTYNENVQIGGGVLDTFPSGTDFGANAVTIRAANLPTGCPGSSFDSANVVRCTRNVFVVGSFGPVDQRFVVGGRTYQYIIVDGIDFDGSNLSNGAGIIGANQSHWIWRNFRAHSTGHNNPSTKPGMGVSIAYAQDNTLLNCELDHNGDAWTGTTFDGTQAPYGIYWHDSYDIVDNCWIHDNAAQGIQIYQSDNQFTQDGNIIRNSVFWNNGYHSPGQTVGTTLTATDISGPFWHGTGPLTQYYNNVLYSSLIWPTDYYLGSLSAHNCIDAGPAPAIVYNNICTNYPGGGINVANSASIVANNIAIGNNIKGDNANFSSVGTTSNNMCSTGATGCTVATPTFVNASAHNYKPLSGSSPQVNAGISTLGGVTVCPSADASQPPISRPQQGTCDIGPYEYAATPLVTVTITSPTSNPTYTTSSATINLGGTSSLP